MRDGQVSFQGQPYKGVLNTWRMDGKVPEGFCVPELHRNPLVAESEWMLYSSRGQCLDGIPHALMLLVKNMTYLYS
jgi:hypothetical protein